MTVSEIHSKIYAYDHKIDNIYRENESNVIWAYLRCDARKITYYNNKIYAIERAKGIIQEYDISDLDNIKTLQYFHTNASCEKAIIINDRVLIPGWYGGLLELI